MCLRSLFVPRLSSDVERYCLVLYSPCSLIDTFDQEQRGHDLSCTGDIAKDHRNLPLIGIDRHGCEIHDDAQG